MEAIEIVHVTRIKFLSDVEEICGIYLTDEMHTRDSYSVT
jgi:hypothetical protein